MTITTADEPSRMREMREGAARQKELADLIKRLTNCTNIGHAVGATVLAGQLLDAGYRKVEEPGE